jgi:prepilin-type N-terminal cleavage/methylation domain-containing protein
VFERYRELQERRESGESEGGFTLIELLIVIIVLGILAAIVIFSLTGVTGQSAVAACNTDAKAVQTAVQAYETNPPTGVAAGTAPTSINALAPNYIHAVPSATTGSQGYAISLDATTKDQVDVSTQTVTNANYDTVGCGSA